MKLFLIDGISPFFVQKTGKTINWSGIPFQELEVNGRIQQKTQEQILKNLRVFVQKVKKIGYTAITFDNLAHITNHHCYSIERQEKISHYQAFYTKIFALCKGLDIYITADIIHYNQDIAKYTRGRIKKVTRFLQESVCSVFEQFPAVSGIIFRFGETDGNDITHDFKSRRVIQSARQLRYLIKNVLPVFEQHQKWCICRTWTIGAHSIGDMVWNPKTIHEVFSTIKSEQLILSSKYGGTDFFRYLPLNKHFLSTSHKKIVEFQARREYEGFGEFPSFIGKEYMQYRNTLVQNPTVIGIMTWCQTGGWSHFCRRTFIDKQALWSEINTICTLELYKKKTSLSKSIQVASTFLKIPSYKKLEKLLLLSEDAIRSIFYIDEFAARELYFRRIRVPPLFWIFWDTVIINPFTYALIQTFVKKKTEAAFKAQRGLEKIEEMKNIAADLQLPTNDITFFYETAKVICKAREFLIYGYSKEREAQLQTMIYQYNKKYVDGYKIAIQPVKGPIKKFLLKLFVPIMIRKKEQYRLIDRVMTNRTLSRILSIPFILAAKNINVAKNSQSIGTFFK